jgi:hypothetical protein
MKQLKVLLILSVFPSFLWGQTFTDRRVINSQSVETLKKNQLEFRVAHRFGDMFGTAGGWSTFYGLENAADILIGFNYGISDRWDIGINRTAGAGLLRKLINTSFKWKALDQFSDNPSSISLAVSGLVSVSTSRASSNEEAIDHFPRFLHRVSYTTQFMLARKWSEVISTQLLGGYQHRNVVYENDQNGMFFAGFSGRVRFSKGFAILFDGIYPFSKLRTPENGYYPYIGGGIELNTGGGHVFQINLTNAKGLIENDFIPYTQSHWADGEFRIGFTISRIFRV